MPTFPETQLLLLSGSPSLCMMPTQPHKKSSLKSHHSLAVSFIIVVVVGWMASIKCLFSPRFALMTPIMTNYPALDKGIATLRTLEGDAYLSPKTVEFRDERVICLTSTPRTGNDGSWIQAGKQGNSHSRHKRGTEEPKPERERCVDWKSKL